MSTDTKELVSEEETTREGEPTIEPPSPTGVAVTDAVKIEKVVTFYDSHGIERSIFYYKQRAKPGSIYISPNDVKVIDTDFADIGDSPFVSPGPGKKYIVIELLGPGDTADLAIADEDGKLIVARLLKSDPKFMGYLAMFDSWQSSSTFLAKAISYGEGPLPLKLLVNAATGEIVEGFESREEP